MKKKYIAKRIATAVLSGILLVSSILAIGCGNTGSTEKGSSEKGKGASGTSSNSAKGRYVEVLKHSFENVGDLSQLLWRTDGSLAAVDKKNGKFYLSTDNGESFQEESVPVLTELMQGSGDGAIEVHSLSMAPDGSIFFAYVDWSKGGDNVMQIAWIIKPDGTQIELDPIPYADSVSESVYLENGLIYTLGMLGNVYSYDTKNSSSTLLDKKVIEMQGTGNYQIGAWGEGIIITDGEKAYYYDSSMSEPDNSDEIFGEFLAKELSKNGLSMAFAATKESIYTASQGGLYSHVKGGSMMEELLSGTFSCMGDPTISVTAMTANEDGSFFIAYDNGEIYSYTYDANVSATPEEVLQVYGLYDNITVRQAVSRFRKDHPEVYVKFEVGISGEDSVTASDAIQALNTRLLAGEGPDVLLLDGMPIDSYIEKGMLEDLSANMEKIKQESSFYDNILEAYNTKEGLFCVPIRFYIPAILTNEEYKKDMSDLKSLADAVVSLREEKSEEGTILGSYSAEELLQILYLTSSPAFLEKGKLKEDSIKEFLTESKRIFDAEQQNITEERREGRKRMETFLMESGKNTKIEMERLRLQTKTIDLLPKEVWMPAGYLTGMDDLKYVTSMKGQIPTLQYQPMPGQSEGVFTPNGIIGLNAKSKEKENAVAFLNTLLGKDVQGVDLGDGFPVNADAYELYCKKLDDSLYSTSFEGEDGTLYSLDITWPSEEEISTLKDTMISGLHVPTQTDAVLKDTILTAGQLALTGEKTIEDCVDEIKQKMSLYLAE